jgi:hypothetical protein
VTVDTLARFQIMTGWEANTQSGQSDPAFPEFRDALFDEAVKELGINRLRVEIYAGEENPVDLILATGDNQRCKRAATVNDNDNPRLINPAGFHFSVLDSTIARIVVPIKQRLEARGERLFVNLNYVAFLDQCPPPVYVHAVPAEYAEFIFAAFVHLRDTFGFVPDAVEIILEPDNVTVWKNGKLIGEAMVATAARLAEAGFRPTFIAPSVADLGLALIYLDGIYSVPGVRPLLGEIAYHRYGTVAPVNLGALATRAKAEGARTAMLEHIGSDVEDLYADLTIANVSAWQQFTLAFPSADNGGHYFGIENARPVVASRTRYLRQYFHYVRLGAQRVGATSSASAVRAVAFENANRGLVVVVHTNRSGQVELKGLRPGNYGVSATTSDVTWAELGPQVAGPEGSLSFTAPGPGVMTVYSR